MRFVKKVSVQACLLSSIVIFLAACQPAQPTLDPAAMQTLQAEIVAQTLNPSGQVQLTPFLSPTVSSTPDPFTGASATPLPSPTATPRTHVVKAGEDMGGIAYLYGITVPILQEANPEVNPHAMSVGTVLQIPAPLNPPGEGEAGALAATPIPVSIGPAACYPAAEDGLWCFAVAYNNQETAVESVAAVFRVIGPGGENFAEEAPAMLDTIPAGGSLPLAAYFSGPAPAGYQAGAELVSALPLADPAARYLPVQLEELETSVDPGGLSAQASGAVRLAGETAAGRVWVLAGAFDAAGRPVGLRRWELDGGLPAGESRQFSLTVYSAGGSIARVEVWAEARP